MPADFTDRFLAALWASPEAHLDEQVRAASSAWHQLPGDALRRGETRLRADLENGAWDRRYGELRRRDALDVGLRLVIGELR